MSRPAGADPQDDLNGELTLDRLTADFSVYQRRGGHRFSSDDMVTAWVALQVCPAPQRILDLGCGLGSVLLHLAWSRPEATLEGVEVQDVSFGLLTRNVDHNDLGGRVRIHHGDFRDAVVQTALTGPYDLVTGTPPYFPPGTAKDAADEQRTRARIETRGGIESYVSAGATLLTPDGWLVVCGDADAEDRLAPAAAANGLELRSRYVVLPRAACPALFTVWALRRAGVGTGLDDHVLTLRDTNGERTDDAKALRAFSGFPEKPAA